MRLIPRQMDREDQTPGWGFLHPGLRRVFRWATWGHAVMGAHVLGMTKHDLIPIHMKVIIRGSRSGGKSLTGKERAVARERLHQDRWAYLAQCREMVDAKYGPLDEELPRANEDSSE